MCFCGRRWKTLRKTCAPLAFSLGRRRIVIPIKKKYIFQLIDLRLPGKRSGGVHVFHSVFQRLPQKHECFEHVLPGQRPWPSIFARFQSTSRREGRMRKQEQRFPAGRTETRAQFKVRLARTARNLSAAFFKKSIRDMATRCKKPFNAKGGLFEEGDKKKKKRR